MMEVLMPREKKEWNADIDPRWIRTGCTNLWDSIFIAFRDYRDAMPQSQCEMIKEKAAISMEMDLNSIPSQLEKWLYSSRDESNDIPDSDIVRESFQLYKTLLSQRLFRSELVPYLESYVRDNPHANIDCVRAEAVDKSVLLGEYRYKKKKMSDEVDITKSFQIVMDHLFSQVITQPICYDSIQNACRRMEYHVVILSPQLDVLFDSKNWGKGIEDAEFNDVIIILAHPDSRYDSVGRLSYTKDGHQKISRLFHYDDPAVVAIRAR